MMLTRLHVSSEKVNRIAAPLVHTDKIMNDALWIGVYPGMDPARLDYMAGVIRDFAAAGGRP